MRQVTTFECGACMRTMTMPTESIPLGFTCPYCGGRIKSEDPRKIEDPPEVEKLFVSLNTEQKKALLTTHGIVRIIAAPGSGKTRLLTSRVAFLIMSGMARAEGILAVTFARKAADEMKNRTIQLLENTWTPYFGSGPDISTIHGWCFQVIRENILQFNRGEIQLVDESDQKTILAEIYHNMSVNGKDFPQDEIVTAIEKFKKMNPDYMRYLTGQAEIAKSLSSVSTLEPSKSPGTTEAIIWAYLERQKQLQVFDFTDLISGVLWLFENAPSIRTRCQQRYHYILVDEAQDLSKTEIRLLQILSGIHGNIFFVGDPNQAIYTWRGSDSNFLPEMKKYFPVFQTRYLMKNYRSSPTIINAYNRLTSKTPARELRAPIQADRKDRKIIRVHEASNSKEEAELVTSDIKNGGCYQGTAVLFRTNQELRFMEDACRRKGIPYRIYSGTSFYERTEVKTVLSYLRFFVFLDDLSFKRILPSPSRGIGDRRMQILERYAQEKHLSLYQALKENLSTKDFKKTGASEFVSFVEKLRTVFAEKKIADLLGEVLEQSGYAESLRQAGAEEELKNLQILQRGIYEQERTEALSLKDYIYNVLLYAEVGRRDEKNSVHLMTMHAAKGLEYDNVYLIGFNEGNIPSSRAKTPDALEEERRLVYVALSRAKNNLCITYPRYSLSLSKNVQPSRFLEMIWNARDFRFSRSTPNPAVFRKRFYPPASVTTKYDDYTIA